jgi:aryl sulfotransferase
MPTPAEAARPTRTRVYRNHHLDSTRWDRFETRPGDVVITTAYKSGTTWMQTIVAHLVFPGGAIPGPVMEISPWIDMAARDFDDIVARTGAQTHRRFLKTHLALDGIPYREDVRYVYVGRDLRDVFMSLWNHYSGHNDAAFERVNDPRTLVGEPFPRPPADLHTLWARWIARGWFDWEPEGWPYWSSAHHARTWFAWRHLENILFVHFADLLADPHAEIARVARFLDIPIDEAELDRIAGATSFDAMKAAGDAVMGGAAALWDEGARRFLNQGTNGRWRGVLSDAELAQHRALVERALPRECATWLENGRKALVGAAHP